MLDSEASYDRHLVVAENAVANDDRVVVAQLNMGIGPVKLLESNQNQSVVMQ